MIEQVAGISPPPTAAPARLPAELAEPEFATVVGMVMYGHRARLARNNHDDGWGAKLKSFFKKGA